MPSPPPLSYNTFYHIYNRGNNHQNIFFQDRNYTHFLNLYAKYIEAIAETYAYCLLRNHFHLLVRIKSEQEIIETLKILTGNQKSGQQKILANWHANTLDKHLGSYFPSKKFSNLFNAYAKAINNAYHRTGSLFQHPFGRKPIESDCQFHNLVVYIHRNPQKHGLVNDFRDWKWSSFKALSADSPTKLNRSMVLNWFGGVDAYLSLHQNLVSDTEQNWFTRDDY